MITLNNCKSNQPLLFLHKPQFSTTDSKLWILTCKHVLIHLEVVFFVGNRNTGNWMNKCLRQSYGAGHLFCFLHLSPPDGASTVILHRLAGQQTSNGNEAKLHEWIRFEKKNSKNGVRQLLMMHPIPAKRHPKHTHNEEAYRYLWLLIMLSSAGLVRCSAGIWVRFLLQVFVEPLAVEKNRRSERKAHHSTCFHSFCILMENLRRSYNELRTRVLYPARPHHRKLKCKIIKAGAVTLWWGGGATDRRWRRHRERKSLSLWSLSWYRSFGWYAPSWNPAFARNAR